MSQRPVLSILFAFLYLLLGLNVRGAPKFYEVRAIPNATPGLLSGSGAFQPYPGSFSVVPVVQVEAGPWVTAANVRADLVRVDDALPLPTARWEEGSWSLAVSAVPVEAYDAFLLRYRFTNRSGAPFNGRLLLTVRPLAFDPAGDHPIKELVTEMDEPVPFVEVNGTPRIQCLTPPSTMVVTTGEQNILELLAARAPEQSEAEDEKGRLSGAVIYELHLPARSSRDMILSYSTDGALHEDAALQAAPAKGFEALLADQTDHWREIMAGQE